MKPTAETSSKRWSRLDSDERRAQILTAARELFSERPYGGVSTIEIAAAAGVTRGLVHHYFGTKRSLYLEVVQEMVGAPIVPLVEALSDAGSGSGPDRDWAASVDSWMELIEANREGWLLAISAGETGQDRAMHDILDAARERTASQVVRVLGLDDSPEVRALVRAFGGFAEEITREWLARRRISREQARVLLLGSRPLMVERLLPHVIEARPAGPPRRRRSAPRRAG